MFLLILASVISYLIGSIPTAYIAGKISRGIDIRKFGSGNVGATNTLRVLGKKMGSLVLLIDMIKGAFCVLALPKLFYSHVPWLSLPLFNALITLFVVSGHIWTIFLKFKGGKGVATTCGAVASLSFIPTVISIGIWIMLVILTKYVSVSSIIMVMILPVLLLFFNQPRPYVIVCIILAILIIYTHKNNIKRLLSGSENKIIKK